MVDIVTYILHLTYAVNISSFTELLQVQKRFNNQCSDIIGISKKSTYYPVERNTELWQIMKLMIEHHCHRIPVLSDAGNIETLITQSRIVHMIHENIELFDIREKTIDQLNMGKRQVWSMNKEEKTIIAFQMITKKKVSGLAVVNNDGTLLGNISATDMRNIGVCGESVGRLLNPIEQYIQLNDSTIPLYCVQLGDKLCHVVKKCKDTGAHRLFIVDDNHIPIGVISLVDILSTIIHYHE